MSAIDGGAVPSDVPDDLSRLPSLEEDRVRAALEKRFMDNKIYTNINALLGTRAAAAVHTLCRPAEERACGAGGASRQRGASRRVRF